MTLPAHSSRTVQVAPANAVAQFARQREDVVHVGAGELLDGDDVLAGEIALNWGGDECARELFRPAQIRRCDHSIYLLSD